MQSREYQAFLVIAVFLASGISFLPGALPKLFVRFTVAAVGIISCLLLAGAIIFAIGFSAGFGARSFGQDGLRMLGAALIALYFAVCALTCLPIVPIHLLRRFGLGLHFLYLPIAVYLTSLTGIEMPLWVRLGGFANMLALGLIYAMLWFRMIDAQQPTA